MSDMCYIMLRLCVPITRIVRITYAQLRIRIGEYANTNNHPPSKRTNPCGTNPLNAIIIIGEFE